MRRREDPLPAALHRLRSTLARVQAEAELLELEGISTTSMLEGIHEALEHLGTVEDVSHDHKEPQFRSKDPVTVVLLEDDERLGTLTIRQLAREGIFAALTTSLGAALAHAQLGSQLVVDLSALDIANDNDLAIVRHLGPIITTGANADHAAATGVQVGAVAQLIKPVELSLLVSSIQEAWLTRVR